MTLTGRAKEDFISFMCKKYPHIRWHEYGNMTDSMINALIIEWLDTVKIIVDIMPRYRSKSEVIFCSNAFSLADTAPIYGFKDFESRNDAIESAIIQGDDIYNSNIKK